MSPGSDREGVAERAERNRRILGVSKRQGDREGTPSRPPSLRFSFKRPQGRQGTTDACEGDSIPVTPPRRKAGKGTESENPDGEEVSSEILEPDEIDVFEPQRSGEEGSAQPSIEPDRGNQDSEGMADRATSSNQPIHAGDGDPSADFLQLTMMEIEVCDWGREYSRCPKWKDIWDQVHTDLDNWPKGFQFWENRLICQGRICILKTLQNAHIHAYHDFLGHPGPEKLWKRLVLMFDFADEGSAKAFSDVVMQQCETCQACQRPLRKKDALVYTPIPPHVMDSVALEKTRGLRWSWFRNWENFKLNWIY